MTFGSPKFLWDDSDDSDDSDAAAAAAGRGAAAASGLRVALDSDPVRRRRPGRPKPTRMEGSDAGPA